MPRFERNGILLDRDLFRGSDGKNYLKSPAMEHLFSEYPALGSVFRSTPDRKAFFSAIRAHADASGRVSHGGFLEALGDLYEAGRVKRYQIDGTVLKSVFRERMPAAEDRKSGIYGRRESSSEKAGGESGGENRPPEPEVLSEETAVTEPEGGREDAFLS